MRDSRLLRHCRCRTSVSRKSVWRDSALTGNSPQINVFDNYEYVCVCELVCMRHRVRWRSGAEIIYGYRSLRIRARCTFTNKMYCVWLELLVLCRSFTPSIEN